MSIALPDRPPAATWPWLSRVITAWRLLVLALLLGLAFAAVATMSVDCRDRPNYLLAENGNPIMLEDGSGFLLVEEKRRECQFAVGKVFSLIF